MSSERCRICLVKLESDEVGACQDCLGVIRTAHAIHLTLPRSCDYPGHAERLQAHTARIRAEMERLREDQAEAG
jgi:hypothetical protein